MKSRGGIYYKQVVEFFHDVVAAGWVVFIVLYFPAAVIGGYCCGADVFDNVMHGWRWFVLGAYSIVLLRYLWKVNSRKRG